MAVQPEQALQSILTGRAADGLSVDGVLDLRGVVRAFRLPPSLTIKGNLLLGGSAVTELPDGLTVSGGIDASRCALLRRVGRRVRADSLELKHCLALEVLDEPIDIATVHLDGCTSLTRLPDVMKSVHLSLKGCSSLRTMPKKLSVTWLHLEGCRSLEIKPEVLDGIDVVSVDEVTALPYDWRRFEVDRSLAAHWLVSGHARTGLSANGLPCIQHTWLRTLPDAIHVRGDLNLEGCENLAALPPHVEVTGTLTLTGCRRLGPLPPGLRAGKLVLPDGSIGKVKAPGTSLGRLVRSAGVAFKILGHLTNLKAPPIPKNAVTAVEARRAIAAREASVVVREDLTISGIADLEALPNRLWVFGNLVLSDLARLRELPRDFRITGQLRIERCASLTQLPALSTGRLEITRCAALKTLSRLTCGTLQISHCEALEEIPDGVAVDEWLTVEHCANVARVSDRVHARTVVLKTLPRLERIPASTMIESYYLEALPLVTSCTVHKGVRALSLRMLDELRELPAGLDLLSLEITRCPVTELPPRLCVSKELRLTRCPIRVIPKDTVAISFSAYQMPVLETIDAPWSDMKDLRVQECPEFRSLPPTLRSIRDALVVDGCPLLEALPDGVEVRENLSVQDSVRLRRLPARMPPPAAVELFRTGLEALPAGWNSAKLSWRGMVLSERQLFPPETMTPEEVIGEPNVEVRRVMLERYGLARLITATHAEVVHEDADRGGPRRLIRIAIDGDEPILLLEVRCPSTLRLFHLRVPPQMTSGRQAAAWVAGFWNEADYNPIEET